MILKLTMSVCIISLLVLLTGSFSFSSSPSAKTYDVEVLKIDDVWKVVDASDHTKTKVKVKKKDTIVWTVSGTDTYFQFPSDLFNPVSSGDSLQDGYTKFVKDGKQLKLKVKDNAHSGTYEYAVFCTVDGVFAQGDSPPKIVIE